MISGLQAEQKKEYPNTEVDGIWGPNTMNRCPTLQRYGTVTNKQYVYLLQYALYVNEFDSNGFDGSFGAGVQTAVKDFQAFVGLTSDGIVGKQTWASLMVSYGDADRDCAAADCKTPLTEDTTALLVANGKTAVGRYISGGFDKCLTISELKIIYNAGLKVFPIYQTSGDSASYFDYSKGLSDAYKAYSKYQALKIKDGGTVYFAVDYDATVTDITERIIPYFEGINARLNILGNTRFAVGIYAPRYVCTQLNASGLTISSFVCDMSSGFACNIGHTLPKNWAFDQIKETVLSNDTASLGIDNDFTSERDSSILVDPDNYQGTVNPTLAEYNIISGICECFGIDFNLIGMEIEYGVEMPLLETDVFEIYTIINHSATAPDAEYKISLPVSNGSISSPTFVSSLENVTTKIPIISDCISFPELAVAIDSGMIQVELSITSTLSGIPALALEITSVAIQSEKNELESVLSVGIKIVFSSESSNYEDFLQAAAVLGSEQLEAAVKAYQQMIAIEEQVSIFGASSPESSEAMGYTLLSVIEVGTLIVMAFCGVGIIVTTGIVVADLVSSLGIMGTVALQCF